MKNLQVRLRKLPDGMPTPGDFELIETRAPAPGKGEMLCRTRWLSLDPMNGSARSGYVVPSRAVCEVLESRNAIFNAGDLLVMEAGLQSYCLSDGVEARRVRTGSAPASAALGFMGEAGLAAYCGLLDVAQVRQGETVLVSAASAPLGAMVGQIARIKGCRVIGIAAGRAHCEWCTKEAHFTACMDARTESLEQRLRQLAPRGVDVFFDSVGGEIHTAVLQGRHLADAGRVVLLESVLRSVPEARASGLPIVVREHEHRRDAFLRDAIAWFAEGHIRYREDVVEGLQNAAAHLCRLMRGENFGKALVKA